MKLVIGMAEVQPESSARMVNGAPVHFARVMWMGGETKVANPHKFSGVLQNVEIEVQVSLSGKVGGGFAPRNADGTRGPAGATFGQIVHELRYTAITGHAAFKPAAAK